LSAAAARSRATRARNSARDPLSPESPLPPLFPPVWMWTWLSARGTWASEYIWPVVVPVVCVVASPSARPVVCVVDSVEVLVRDRLTLCRCEKRPATNFRSRPMCSAARSASGRVASRMNAVCLLSR
jgi:hypothetical protein